MAKRLVFDYSNLRAEMTRRRVRLEDLSKMTGISMTTLSTHLARGQKFDCEQAVLILRALELETADPYFFNCKLSKLERNGK